MTFPPEPRVVRQTSLRASRAPPASTNVSFVVPFRHCLLSCYILNDVFDRRKTLLPRTRTGTAQISQMSCHRRRPNYLRRSGQFTSVGLWNADQALRYGEVTAASTYIWYGSSGDPAPLRSGSRPVRRRLPNFTRFFDGLSH